MDFKTQQDIYVEAPKQKCLYIHNDKLKFNAVVSSKYIDQYNIDKDRNFFHYMDWEESHGYGYAINKKNIIWIGEENGNESFEWVQKYFGEYLI